MIQNEWRLSYTCGMPDANKRQTWDDFFEKNRVSDEVFGIMEELPTYALYRDGEFLTNEILSEKSFGKPQFVGFIAECVSLHEQVTREGEHMEISPIIVSMKTASVSHAFDSLCCSLARLIPAFMPVPNWYPVVYRESPRTMNTNMLRIFKRLFIAVIF